MRQRRIRILSTCMAILIAVFAIYQPIRSISWIWNLAFGDPTIWTKISIVDNDAIIPMSTRIGLFALWFGVIAIGVWALICGIRLMWRFRDGHYFDTKTTGILFQVGTLTCVSILLDTAMTSFHRIMLTLLNADGPDPMQYWYDAGDISILLCGLGFMVVGWIMREAGRIADENEAFV